MPATASISASSTAAAKLGGLDAQGIIADDELKPDLAVTKIKGLIERDAVDFVTGIIFSNAASSGAAHRQRSSPLP